MLTQRPCDTAVTGTATAHEYMRNALRSTKIEEAFVVKEKLRAPTDVQGPAIPPTEPRLLSAPSNFTFPVQTVEFEGRSGQRAPRGGGCCWRYYPSAQKWERALRYVWPQDAILDIWVVQAPLRSLVISSRVERRRYGIEGVKACQEIWRGAESGSLRLAPSTRLLCKESARRLRAIKFPFMSCIRVRKCAVCLITLRSTYANPMQRRICSVKASVGPFHGRTQIFYQVVTARYSSSANDHTS